MSAVKHLCNPPSVLQRTSTRGCVVSACRSRNAAAFLAYSRSLRQSMAGPPIPKRNRLDGPPPSARHTDALQVNSSSQDCSPSLHTLKSGSLRQSRGGSMERCAASIATVLCNASLVVSKLFPELVRWLVPAGERRGRRHVHLPPLKSQKVSFSPPLATTFSPPSRPKVVSAFMVAVTPVSSIAATPAATLP
jgi:hypothetical protein